MSANLNSEHPIVAIQKNTHPELFEAAMALRTEVFVQEQKVPLEEEYDHYDETAYHWVLLDPQTQLVNATGRLVDYQEACQTRPVAKIGRVAVKQSCRGQGLGKVIMQAILQAADQQGYDMAILDSQTYALAFYEQLGFVAEGEEFMDAGLPHYRMRKQF